MSGAVLVAVAAAIGNLLQGWDNATIAGFFFNLAHLVTHSIAILLTVQN